MALDYTERMFYEYYKDEINSDKSIDGVYEWLQTLSDEDRIMAHAFGLLKFIEGIKEGLEYGRDSSRDGFSKHLPE